jgi:DNA processing protein
MGSLGASLALWVRGDASLTKLTGTAAEVTGTRWASGYGKTVAAEFGYGLARAGVTAVGGGSAGVSAQAGVAIAKCATEANFKIAMEWSREEQADA